tara:strand:+ start:213 stop:1481 length:1269 start_codon:yes stop_codon:yes gene_type:complete
MNNARLEDASKVITKGTTPTTVGGKFTSKGVNFVKSDSVGQFKHLDSNLFQFIDEKTDEKLKRSRLKENDLLFSIAGAYLGKLSIVRKKDLPANTNQAVGIVRIDKEKADVHYLYYFFSQNNINQYINNLSSQSSQPNLNLGLLGGLKFSNKSLSTQKQIAKVLSDLDAKIEINNKINTALEAMAKTLYDYWFVQFDFPDSTGKPYKSSGGKMVFKEALKREIPVGWEVKELGDISEIKRGKLVTAKTANLKGKVKVVSAGIDYSYFHSESNRLENTITVSGSGANAGFINFWREPIFANDCSTVRGKTDSETLVILEFLRMRQNFIFQQARGSAQPHVYPNDISILKIALPNNDLFNDYGKQILPSNEIVANNLIQNQKLSELRDWLLPMLMNGQVTIGKAEKEVEGLGLVAEEDVKYGKG